MLFFIAILLILPLSIYVMNNWLENYAYRIDMHPWFYILAILIVAGITFVTIAVGTWNTANRNPVESLRDE
jgi:putative ABC transport system permease protein